MLSVPVNEWGWNVSNYSATAFTLAAFGTAVTPATNSKGSYATLLSNTADDSFGIYVCVGACGTTATAYGGLLDIAVDPANGTSWTLLIPDMAFCGSSIVLGGAWWWFPLFIPKGSAVGARASASTGVAVIRVGAQLVGQPTRPDLVRSGSFVETFNAAAATSFGTTAVVQGATGAWGSYTASLGTTANTLWYWTCGLTMNDSVFTKYISHRLEVWGGASNADKQLIEHSSWTATDAEQLANGAAEEAHYRVLPGGSGIYVRAMSTGAAESNVYAIVHGVGG